VSPVRYELGFYIPEDDILHIYHCEDLKSYTALREIRWYGLDYDLPQNGC
jgi:hypothetical protein